MKHFLLSLTAVLFLISCGAAETPTPTITKTAVSHPSPVPTSTVPPPTATQTAVPTPTASATATLTNTLEIPLLSYTLVSVDMYETDWVDWIQKLLNTNTDCAPYSSDLLVAAFRSDKFRAYNLQSNELIWDYDMPTEPIGGGAIIFSPDNETLAHGGSDQILYIWDVYTGDLLHKIDFENYIFDIEFTGNGQWVIVLYGVEGGQLAAVNTRTGEVVRFPILSPVYSTTVLDNSSHVLAVLYEKVGDDENRILTWNPEGNEVNTLIPLSPDDWVSYEHPDGEKEYYGGLIRTSPNGDIIALIVDGESERNFQLWNVSEQKWVHVEKSVITRKESLLNFQFSPDGLFFALFSTSVLDGANVKVWQSSGEFVGEVAEEVGNNTTIQCPHQENFSNHYVNALTSVDFTPDSAYLTTFGYDQDGMKQVVLWSLLP